jgi:hypothetical protein
MPDYQACVGVIPVKEKKDWAELKRKLDQATRLMDATGDPVTKSNLTEMVRELERIVEIAADEEERR